MNPVPYIPVQKKIELSTNSAGFLVLDIYSLWFNFLHKGETLLLLQLIFKLFIIRFLFPTRISREDFPLGKITKPLQIKFAQQWKRAFCKSNFLLKKYWVELLSSYFWFKRYITNQNNPNNLCLINNKQYFFEP